MRTVCALPAILLICFVIPVSADDLTDILNAAENDNARAFYYVSVAYTSGTGVARNYAEAEKWAHKAAERRLSSGARHLGLFHQPGQGVPVDRVEAQKWYYVHESLRPEDDPFLSRVNGNYMTEEQLALAREQADEWLTKHQ